MKDYLYYICFVFLCFFTSCKRELRLIPSNEVYVSVISKNDSVMVQFTNSCDTLLRKEDGIYDTSGRLFISTCIDTVYYLDNGKTTRWIKKNKDKDNEYTSATYTGSCWVERQNVRIYTFDRHYNITKIEIPGYEVNYVPEEYALPLQQNSSNIKYYYPNNEKLNHFVIKYLKDSFIIKSKQSPDEILHKINGDYYLNDGKIFLSNSKDTSIIYGPPLPPLEGFPMKFEIHPLPGNCETFSTKCYINPDTAYHFISEFIYDNNYRITTIRQMSTAEFIPYNELNK